MRFLLFVLGFVLPQALGGQMARAACAPTGQTYMACTLNNGSEVLEVCLEDGWIKLTRAPADGAPTLALELPFDLVRFEPWPGVSTFNERIFLPDGVLYREVWVGEIRAYGEEEVFSIQTAGIETVANYATAEEEFLETTDCDRDSVIYPAYGVLDGLKRAAGLCWDGYADGWVACDGQE